MKIVFFIVFAFCFEVYSQSFKDFKTGFTTIFKDRTELNSYYFGGNPALLSFSSEDELLTVKADINYDDGKFKRFIEPSSNRNYMISASGKKSIDENQKFIGSFGFQRAERVDWDWIFTRDYQTGNPFLIGDSTSGKSRINGIIMNAGYAINLTQKLSAGIVFDYSVDEMLKEVSPKPTSVHRDISSRVGLNYNFSSLFNAGLILDVYDKNERIAYREDEGSILRETVILKFKGYDYPNVFRKKTETRYSYINGYSGGITFSADFSETLLLNGYFISGFNKTTIKDDAIDPRPEGFWKNDFINAGLQFFTYLFNPLQASIAYNIILNDGWAKYPVFNVLYYERQQILNSIVLGLEYPFSKKLSAGLESGISLTSIKEKDHYSIIFMNGNNTIFYVKPGILINWKQDISTLISYSFLHNSVSDFNLTIQNPTNYYSDFRQFDILYYQTEYNKHSISLTSRIDPGIGGLLYFYFDYSITKPVKNSAFEDKVKNIFSSVIEYRVKVF